MPSKLDVELLSHVPSLCLGSLPLLLGHSMGSLLTV